MCQLAATTGRASTRRNALELRSAPVLELDAGAGDEIPHRLRDEDVARPCLTRDPRADRDRESGDLAVDELASERPVPRLSKVMRRENDASARA
jgi:hypothetical protein